ncbi:dTDP-4-dehydrorhamnose reductase [Psychrobacillus sp.]|uniref:dTDP-4-dehydrorhamnose reductase n=1 Tax=Psychrobacillus sp. TaxID=1871623 RepID=UPI0028BD20A3|nr:dTDP-4-dehydrorhamnose reductase [Psychrobacillus sp.]
MKIFVTGRSGQLGFDVVKEGFFRGHEMHGFGSKELDITDRNQVLKYVTALKPEVIIHCAAYTAVDKAEDDQERCSDVNVNGTRYLIEAAKLVRAKFIYISTDYVFDGQGITPYKEEDKVNPVGYYGLTKLQGEQIVQENLEEFFIVRISWVFGINGNNFVKTMLKLAESRDELNVVSDQVGSPTYTVDLARLLLDMIRTEKFGIYHASNEGFCSWADFATEIFRQANLTVKVKPIPAVQFQTRAKRPNNSRLSKDKLENNGFKRLPGWENAVKRFIENLQEEV